MASSKRIGFFWGEEKITIVEFDRNAPVKVISTALGSKTSVPSPFSSNLTEEIQLTAVLQRLLQDNQISGGSFYVALPMKEIILRSFIIPFVKSEDIQTAIKFEAKKYMPFEINDLSFVYYTIPFFEDNIKRLQVIFFAARKEILARYDRIFKQVNATVTYCEPYMVSLTKSLLFKKEIKPTDQIAFLILEENLGRICFIDQGIPQFIREFSIGPTDGSSAVDSTVDSLNLKIVNEVGNSFDFYARQFTGERIEQMLVASEFVQKDLLNSLETELKVKIRKYTPAVTAGNFAQNNDMDAIYAMGACVTPPIDSLAEFNFLEDKSLKNKFVTDLIKTLKSFKEIMVVFLVCVFMVASIYLFLQAQLKVTREQYNQLTLKEGDFLNTSVDSLQADVQKNTDLLNRYKAIKIKSSLSSILLKIASHLPQGARLDELNLQYDEGDFKSGHVAIDMKGNVYREDFNQQVAVVNQIFSELKEDKELSSYFKKVNLTSIGLEEFKGKKVTGFSIHCS